MIKLSNHIRTKKYIFPSLILGGFLLFGLMSPALVGASIIVTGPTTTTTHPLCHDPSCTTTTTHPLCHDTSCTKYTCNANYQCVVASNGEYTSLSTCQNNCIAPPRYSCNPSTYQCYVATNGAYATLNDCQTNCQPPLTRYTCNSSYQCVAASNGEYTSLSTCQNNCIAPPRYSCNPSTYQCYVATNGAYATLNDCQTNCQAPPENFDFSLTNSGNIIVTKPSYDSISGSNTITANLNSGTAQSVSFSQSGLPYGVSAYSLYSCYPTCSKSNTLTINSSASVGTFQITVTATGGGIIRTTTYSLIIQDSYNDTLSVSCYASPNPAQINQTVTFYSNVSGGSGNYSYYWSGAAYGNNSYSQESFSSDGNYKAYLTVHDSQNRSASTSCRVHIDEPYTNAPTLDLWADKYTINQGESTYLRWTSTNANYCVASTGWTGNKSTNGYESVSPNYDTTYSLTCHGDGGQISRSVTIYVTSTGTNLSLTKLGRNLSAGERVYAKVIRVTQGDVIEFHLTVTAGNNKDLYNVVVKDILPSVLSYIPGTTQINNIIQPDTITTTGLSLGTIYKGTTKTIVFQALSISPEIYLTYTNTAEVTADNESKITDSASITYGLVAGAATIKTGAKDSLLISIIVSLISSIMIWYYLKFNPKGKLAFVAIESKARDFSLAYLRRKMIRQNRN